MRRHTRWAYFPISSSVVACRYCHPSDNVSAEKAAKQSEGNRGSASKEPDAYRTLDPRVHRKLEVQRAKGSSYFYRRNIKTTTATAPSTTLPQENPGVEPWATMEAAVSKPSSSSSAMSSSTTATVVSTLPATGGKIVAPMQPLNEVQQLMEELQGQIEASRRERNESIPYPERPEALTPEFRRLKRHTKQTVVVADPDYPTFAQKEMTIPLPPPQEHPWVRKNTPIGPFIVHGDGQIGATGVTGLVGFDDAPEYAKLPTYYRGLQHHSVLQKKLPQDNGRVLQDAVVKHSFTLTGRGVFATRPIRKGETIMIVQSTARSVGVKGELQRLEEMCIQILLACRDGDERARAFLHEWVLTGQPSSLLEHWPAASTERVLNAVNNSDGSTLDALELHPIHIARLAAIIDLNSFLVESSYAERKGMAYFPEAGFLNHSCVPNATYDIMPEHMFRESDYFIDEAAEAQAMDGCEDEGEGEDYVKAQTHVEAEEAKGVNSLKPTVTTSSTVAAAVTTEVTRNVVFFGSEERLSVYPDLTESGAPVYLFCSRAERDIEAGEEIRISYVPPQWTFDNRQYVLHDRYHFWCKCEKCAPVLDRTYARVPKLLVVCIFFSIILQGMVLYQRDQKNAVDAEFERLNAMSEEERMEEMRARGIKVEELTVDAVKRRRRQRAGLFELLEQERERRLYEIEGRGPMKTLDQMNPLSIPPR